LSALAGRTAECPLARGLLLNIVKRRFDAALDVLKGHDFRPWKGGRVIRQLFVLANLGKGRQAFAAGKFEATGSTFQAETFPTYEACVCDRGNWRYLFYCVLLRMISKTWKYVCNIISI
jgi:hypothetical protein